MPRVSMWRFPAVWLSNCFQGYGLEAKHLTRPVGFEPTAFRSGGRAGRWAAGFTGAATLSGSANSQELLSTPGIEVDVAINGDGFPSVTISNSTGLLIPAVLDQGGTDGGITLAARL